MRIARGADGPALDLDARMPGRGAWIHPDEACLSQALGRGRVAKALRARITTEGAGRLERTFSEGIAHREPSDLSIDGKDEVR